MGQRQQRRLRQILFQHLRRVKGRLALAAVCTLGVTATELLKPWPLKIILDHGILDQPLPPALAFLQILADNGRFIFLAAAASGIVVISLGEALFSYLQVFITSSIGYKMVYALRRELFAHLQRLSLSFHNRAKSGDLLTRIAGDTTALREVFAESILKFCSESLMLIGMCAIMIGLNWKLSAIAFATLPFLCYTLFHLYRKTKASVKTQKRQEGKVASRMGEVLSAIPLVQAFAREQYEEQRFDVETAVTVRESIRIARLEAAAARSTLFVTSIGTSAAVLFGAMEVSSGAMTPGDLVLCVTYLSNLYKPLRSLAKLSTNFSKAMASGDRLSEVLDLEPEIRDRDDAIEVDRLKGEIVFDGVSFDYGDTRDVLRQVSFSVSPGQRLALVGASGAGKSTIVSLILRLYEPQEGAILIDGIDIRHYRRESLRRQIGIVPQQSILFGATVRENIAYGNPEATMEEIVAAAEAANADEFIRQLEDGYDSVIGERGATLSGGQRQRIAIARALIRNAPILILDEPMTGLDVESEARVREALARLMAGKTCIIITHDLQSVADADEVLVLEDGRILERGEHANLLARSRRYRQLYELDVQQSALADGPDRGGATAVELETEPAARVRSDGFPADPDFPQLEIAANPARMLEVFRAHLKPLDGKAYQIEACVPFRFRCRQSSDRCVLQYTLRLCDPANGCRRELWVTGLLYARAGEAERLWRQLRATDPSREIPDEWLCFEPVSFIPDLQMVVQVFPYDRRLSNLGRVLSGALPGFEPLLLARLEPGAWRPTEQTLEPMRYRTELGAALRFTTRARESRTATTRTLRCYLKVYRNRRGEETFRLLRSLSNGFASGAQPFSVVKPICYLSELRTLVLEEATGTSLQTWLLDGRDPRAVLRAVARAVAALNQARLELPRRHSLADQLKDVRRAARLVQWARPEVSDEVAALTDLLVAGLDEVAPAPIHRDLKPDHIFLQGDRVTFIDVDAAAMADPVRDPAHLFAHLAAGVGLDSIPPERARALAAAFAGEYFKHVPEAWRSRFPLHCAGALIEVAGGIFKRQEPRWPEKVASAIEQARACLLREDGAPGL